MSPRRKVANLLGLAVLATLLEGPKHPYEVGKDLRERGDARSVRFNPGTLYSVFGQLAGAGFIAEQETLRDGQRPERTVYALTDAGRSELRAWLSELVATPEHEYPSFVAALSMIAALPPEEVAELLTRRLGVLARQREGIEALVDGAQSAGVDPVFLVEEEYRLALLAAEASFIERFIERIRKPDQRFGLTWREFHEEGKKE